jgi:hypothetical protein
MFSAASNHLERTSFLPAAAPAAKVTSYVTTHPALATVSFVVSFAASSPAGCRCRGARAFASFRAGQISKAVHERTCRAFSDHPLPTTWRGWSDNALCVDSKKVGPARIAERITWGSSQDMGNKSVGALKRAEWVRMLQRGGVVRSVVLGC